MQLYLMESQCKPRGMQSGNGVFAFIPEVPPDLGEAKVCKPRGPPDLGEAKVCKPRGMQSENGVFAFLFWATVRCGAVSRA